MGFTVRNAIMDLIMLMDAPTPQISLIIVIPQKNPMFKINPFFITTAKFQL